MKAVLLFPNHILCTKQLQTHIGKHIINIYNQKSSLRARVKIYIHIHI